MEIIIALGIGCWFMLTGLIATIAVYKSYNRK